MMRKTNFCLLALSAALLAGGMGSCATSSPQGYLGTMAGAEIGGTIGEAIGWLSTNRHDGPGKAMLGSIVGTVAGAIIGNHIAAQSEKSDTRRHDGKKYSDNTSSYYPDYQTEGGYDASRSNAYKGKAGKKATISERSFSEYGTPLTIRNVTYQDENGDGRFSRYETINVIYEVTNTASHSVEALLYIDDPEQSKNFAYSPASTVTINPGQTIRYKAKAFCKNVPKSNYTDIRIYAQDKLGTKTAATSLRVRCE